MHSFDIFCRVIDNLGDAGVCWRLAQRIKAEALLRTCALTDTRARSCTGPSTAPSPDECAIEWHSVKVRLFIDDLHRLSLLVSGLDPEQANQHLQGIEILHWNEASTIEQPAEIVIEAFGCDLPAEFCQRMPGATQLWINLEYLSAESWVSQWHGLPSVQPNGLSKFFFFPGFTSQTGGLLREPDLEIRRQHWVGNPEYHQKLLRTLNLDALACRHLDEGALQILFFGYRNAPIQDLIAGIEQSGRKAVILHPGPLPDELTTGQIPGQSGSVLIRRIPFVPQRDFDTLLWGSHLNCVRGEDSLVRSLWAQRPMLWQIYPQHDQAHHVKLDAFLRSSPFPEKIKTLMRAWNGLPAQPPVKTALVQALAPNTLRHWQQTMHDWYSTLSQEPDLASRLLEFCAKKSGTG